MNQFPSVRFIKALCNGAKESPSTALGLVACMSVTLFATNVFTGELLLSSLAAAIDPVDTRLSSPFALKVALSGTGMVAGSVTTVLSATKLFYAGRTRSGSGWSDGYPDDPDDRGSPERPLPPFLSGPAGPDERILYENLGILSARNRTRSGMLVND